MQPDDLQKMENNLILQIGELRTELQIIQREQHKMSTDIEVMKTRAQYTRLLLTISVVLNIVMLFVLAVNIVK